MDKRTKLVETYERMDGRTNTASPRVDPPGGSTENMISLISDLYAGELVSSLTPPEYF